MTAGLFPADLRPQAHEIIRTWAFYTIVKAHLHENSIPWQNLMISGWCLAADKTKMSKSKGNVVTPVELIRDKGADAVRYWASTSRLGADTAFSEDLLKIGKKLVTKLWNAAQFVAPHIATLQSNSPLEGESANTCEPVGGKTDFTPPGIADAMPALPQGEGCNMAVITEPLDRWIITRLARTVAKATQEFAAYEYCDARVAVEEFFWKDFCDNYLELVKGRAYGEVGTPQSQRSAQHALYYCLDAILRLFAPFVPHVAEELYTHLFDARGSVHARGSWPLASDYFVDAAAEQSGIACVGVLNYVRKAKSEKNVSIKFPIKCLEVFPVQKYGAALLEKVLPDLKSAGNIAEVVFVGPKPTPATESGIPEGGGLGLGIMFAEQAEVA